MQHHHFDIVVVGGGLAGLSTSILAADAGYKVALFEKHSYPFHRVCGEYISMESHDFMRRLGFPFGVLQLPRINKLQVSDPAGRTYPFDLPLGGFGISRYLLDDLLYKIAVNKGVTVYTAAKVTDVQFSNDHHTVVATTGNVTASIVTGSYGKRSNIDISRKRNFILQKPGKLNNYIGVKYHVRYPQPEATIALHNFYNGYCGISAIEADTCCLCYLTTAGNLEKNDNSIERMQEQVLFKNPQLKKILTTATFLYDKPITISQISFEKKTQVEDHMLMTGDAAGMITPLCGNGMSMAMHSAQLAFTQMDQFLKDKITREMMELQYTNAWNKAFQQRLSTGRLVQRFFGNELSTAVFLKAMKVLPPLSRKIIRMTHGDSF